jgi:hypothetical protein
MNCIVWLDRASLPNLNRRMSAHISARGRRLLKVLAALLTAGPLLLCSGRAAETNAPTTKAFPDEPAAHKLYSQMMDAMRKASTLLIEPRGEDGVWREAVRLAGEVGEGGLGDFLGQLRGADLAERGGEDQIEVAPDDFGEGILGLLPGISRE